MQRDLHRRFKVQFYYFINNIINISKYKKIESMQQIMTIKICIGHSSVVIVFEYPINIRWYWICTNRANFVIFSSFISVLMHSSFTHISIRFVLSTRNSYAKIIYLLVFSSNFGCKKSVQWIILFCQNLKTSSNKWLNVNL